jgi:hypothetical protein
VWNFVFGIELTNATETAIGEHLELLKMLRDINADIHPEGHDS